MFAFNKIDADLFPNLLGARVPLAFFLSDDGETQSNGSINARGNYSAEAKDFYVEAAAGELIILSTLKMYIRDTGAFDADKYGNNITLTNGICLINRAVIPGIGEVTIDITKGHPIKNNADWSVYLDPDPLAGYGTGDEILTGKLTFEKDAGVPIILDGDAEESIRVRLNDDFSGLVSHYFRVTGFKVKKYQDLY